MFATCLLDETALWNDYRLDPVAEAFAGLDEGDPGHVGHHVIHGVLRRLDSVMGMPVGLPINHAPHVVVQRVEVWRAEWP